MNNLKDLIQQTEEKFEKEWDKNGYFHYSEKCKGKDCNKPLKSFLRQAQLDVVEWYEKRFLEIYEAVDKAKEDKDNLLIDKIAGLYMETCVSAELKDTK